MSFENFKSILLTLLVLMSLVLTWSLWTYQPSYGVTENPTYIQDVNIGLKNEPRDLIFPQKIMFHKNGRHYGTFRGSDIETVMSNIRQSSFSDFRDITPSMREEYLDFIHSRDGVEIIFPTEVPMETLKGIISIEDEQERSLSFDRIVIHANDSQVDNPVAYFVSYDHHYVYEARISNFSYRLFVKEVYSYAPRFPQYFAYTINSYRNLFLPVDTVTENQITYYSIKFPGEEMKNALFTDPTNVKRDIQSSGEETYSDGARGLYINSTGDSMRYVNPSGDSSQMVKTPQEIIRKSINFVNDHSGWTDTYRLSKWNLSNQSTDFRLYINGLPVFNYSGLSKISLTWGGTGPFEIYRRPLFELYLSIDSDTTQVTLPSGHTLIDFLTEPQSVDITKLEDAVIGYELKKDRNSAKVTVEPIWCILENGIWKKVVFEDNLRELGGNVIGLE